MSGNQPGTEQSNQPEQDLVDENNIQSDGTDEGDKPPAEAGSELGDKPAAKAEVAVENTAGGHNFYTIKPGSENDFNSACMKFLDKDKDGKFMKVEKGGRRRRRRRSKKRGGKRRKSRKSKRGGKRRKSRKTRRSRRRRR